MLPFVLPFLFFLHHLVSISTAATEQPYKPTDYFLINCGSPSNTPFNGRNWDTDAHLNFLPPNINEISSAASAFQQDPSVDQVPYMSARVFHSEFTYPFHTSPGPKFLRLYFYPPTYSAALNGTTTPAFLFTVTANGYTLLSNFSAVSATEQPFISKEFIVNVKDNQILNLTFSPSLNSYSFVNGIEIVSMPTNLYLRNDDHPLIKNVDDSNKFYIDVNNSAFERLYRLNVGGRHVEAVNDTGMFRQWSMDDDFLYGAYLGNPWSLKEDIPLNYTAINAYTAPRIVYATGRAMGKLGISAKLIWRFHVDSGFQYLLRLHFCEINPEEINTQNQRVFSISIANKTAELEFDVMYQSGGFGIPIFRDYVVRVPHPSDGRPSKRDIWLALFPNMHSKPQYADAILNGLEIFKLNGSDGNLAGPNPELRVVIPNTQTSSPNSTNGKTSRTTVYASIGGVIGAAAVLSILAFLISRRRKRLKDSEKSTCKSSWAPLSIVSSSSAKTAGTGSTLSLPSDLCRSFLFEELKSATANFHDNFVIGRGGFGNVYKGYIDNGATAVAIKRLNPSSSQGALEFTTEIEMLSKLRHVHLVSLIGYCDEQGEMILVYEYMVNGTLRDHLYHTKNSPMPWKQRLQICIGAAKGLQYLHGGAKHGIIHRDVKSTNILLDDKLVAKVSDFGLSKTGPIGATHVSTVVKGSLGYVDPEYFRRQQLTQKSDVYSFGMVLLEVLCARAAIIPNAPKEQVNLGVWARRNYRNGSLDRDIVDPSIKDEIAPECLRSYAETAFRCLKERGTDRPTMNDVVWSLEFTLQLQEAADKFNGDSNLEKPPQYPLLFGSGYDQVTTADDADELFSGSGESAAKSNGSAVTTSSGSDRLKSETVFSEIMNSTGR